MGGQAIFGRALSLLGFVVLARLLTVEEYGIVALAGVFIALLSVLAAGGYSQTLVQLPTVDKEDLDTVFWIGMGTSAALTLVLCAAAWPLADIFNEPLLRPVLQVLSISFVFIALGATHQAVMQRRFDWRGLAIRTMVANLVATAFGIAFAVVGFGVWALVVQTVLASIVGSVALMIQSGYRPSLYVSTTRFRTLFRFSRNYMGNGMLVFLNNRTDDFLIGSVLGSTALGIYTVGYRVLVVMIEVLTTTVRSVAFPMFSQLQQDPERLLRAYRSANRMASAVSVPAFVLVAVLAPEMVHVVFGQKWDASVPVVRVLCAFGALQGVAQLNAALLSALGRIQFIFRLGVVSTALQIVAFAVAVPFGITWVAAGFVIRAYLVAPVGFIVVARELNTSVAKTLSGFVPATVSTAVMVAVAFAAKAALGESGPEAMRLVVLVTVSVSSYALALRLSGRPLFDELLDYVRAGLGRPAPASTVLPGG